MGKCGYNGDIMDSITLKNYRCFAGEQTARLAPLTLLVGENSTGKTSFLAMVRALWDVAFSYEWPNFREAPYDLGAFEDIVHNGGARDKLADSFEAGFRRTQPELEKGAISVHATFKESRGVPFPAKSRIEVKGAWIEAQVDEEDKLAIVFGNPRIQWECLAGIPVADVSFPLSLAAELGIASLQRMENGETPARTVSPPTPSELEELTEIVQALRSDSSTTRGSFASAPVQSRPRRTYDPVQQSRDPEGEYIPSYLASLYRRDRHGWQVLKASLEDFGRKSGLFDDISVMSFGNTEGAPFQMQVRKWGKRLKGRHRNLIDVGYGVSQALPLLTELLRPDAPNMFLLQQPEVHLHPSAQAALGSLFCDAASSGKQLIVETHSDYIIDRVRMDVRDGETGLKPEDVSILYFERDELAVKIHSIRLDKVGNVLDAPPNYRQFFAEELRKSIGF